MQPSEEQLVALRAWEEGKSQVCSAAAGSGKSTLILHACKRARGEVVVLTYNRQLAAEMAEKLKGMRAECFTFHGLCSRVYRLAPDDNALREAIEDAEEGRLAATNPPRAKKVCVDEVQDMREAHKRLLKLLFPGAQLMLVGDAKQVSRGRARPLQPPRFVLAVFFVLALLADIF